MKKNNKYLYGYNISSNYGHGWEVECFEDTKDEARQRLKEYEENTLYPVRMTRSRDVNPEWKQSESEKRYNVIRMYAGDYRKQTIEKNFSLEEAQSHCRNPETSSSTCTLPGNTKRTKQKGPWFDGYERMRP
jgi:hypothetical protein